MNILMGLLLFLILLAPSRPLQPEHRFIRRVRIVADLYSAQRLVGATPKQQLNGRNREIDATVYFPEIYAILDSLIRNIHLDAAPNAGKEIDAYVTCLVYRERGRPDTVSFGGPHMQVNGRVGYLQPNALLAIGKYLPRLFERDIYYYLDTIWMKQPAWPKYGYEPVPK